MSGDKKTEPQEPQELTELDKMEFVGLGITVGYMIVAFIVYKLWGWFWTILACVAGFYITFRWTRKQLMKKEVREGAHRRNP